MQNPERISDTIKVLKQAIQEVGDLPVVSFSHKDKKGNIIITALKDVTWVNFSDDTGKNLTKEAVVWYNKEPSLASELISDLERLKDEGDLPIRYLVNPLSYLFPRSEYITTKDKHGINYIVIY